METCPTRQEKTRKLVRTLVELRVRQAVIPGDQCGRCWCGIALPFEEVLQTPRLFENRRDVVGYFCGANRRWWDANGRHHGDVGRGHDAGLHFKNVVHTRTRYFTPHIGPSQ